MLSQDPLELHNVAEWPTKSLCLGFWRRARFERAPKIWLRAERSAAIGLLVTASARSDLARTGLIAQAIHAPLGRHQASRSQPLHELLRQRPVQWDQHRAVIELNTQDPAAGFAPDLLDASRPQAQGYSATSNPRVAGSTPVRRTRIHRRI